MGISYPDPGVIWTETPGSPSVFRVGRMIIVYGDDNKWDDNYNESGKEDWWPSDITVNNLTSLQFVFSDHRLHPCHPAHSSCRHLPPSCASFSKGKVKSQSSSWTNLSPFQLWVAELQWKDWGRSIWPGGDHSVVILKNFCHRWGPGWASSSPSRSTTASALSPTVTHLRPNTFQHNSPFVPSATYVSSLILKDRQ